MAFTTQERVNATAKALLGGVLDADPTAQWYESVMPFGFVLPGSQVWTQADIVKLHPAVNLTQAQANCIGPLSGIVQNISGMILEKTTYANNWTGSGGASYTAVWVNATLGALAGWGSTTGPLIAFADDPTGADPNARTLLYSFPADNFLNGFNIEQYTGFLLGRSPSNFKLYGAVDGANLLDPASWTQLGHYVGHVWVQGDNIFAITSPGDYRYYCFVWLDSPQTFKAIQISRVHLTEGTEAIRLTPLASVNNTFAALSVYGDWSSALLDNWLKPPFVRQLNGNPSNGYAMRLYDGDPNAGGTEVLTTDGTTGSGVNKSVGWVFNYDNGLLLLSSDFSVADPWITGFRYIGETAGSGGGGGPCAPAMSTASRIAYVPTADGILVFDTDLGRLYVWQAPFWVEV